MIEDKLESQINHNLTSDKIAEMIAKHIDLAIAKIVEDVIQKTYDQILNDNKTKIMFDTIKSVVADQTFNNIKNDVLKKATQHLEKLPIFDFVNETVRKTLTADYNFPDESVDIKSIRWSNKISGSNIQGGTIQDFSSTGIKDSATTLKLMVTDNNIVATTKVIVENVTATDSIQTVDLGVAGNLITGGAVVDAGGGLTEFVKALNTISFSEFIKPYQSLLKDNEPLVSESKLSNSITFSNLRQVGNLQDLTVLGDAKFSETLFVSAQSRIGINTNNPRGALTIFDNDSEFTFSRTSRKNIFLGTTTIGNTFEMGVSNQAQMSFSEDIINISAPIRIMGIKFSVQQKVPEYFGEFNEIVFVSTAADTQPLLYICRGNNRWQALGG